MTSRQVDFWEKGNGKGEVEGIEDNARVREGEQAVQGEGGGHTQYFQWYMKFLPERW